MPYVFAQEQPPAQRVFIDINELSPAFRVVIVVSILLYILGMAFIFVNVISKAEDKSPSYILITALSLLTFVALTAAILTSSTGLETIAASGVGAIAGAVSHRFIVASENGKEKEDDGSSVPTQPDQENSGDVSRLRDPEE